MTTPPTIPNIGNTDEDENIKNTADLPVDAASQIDDLPINVIEPGVKTHAGIEAAVGSGVLANDPPTPETSEANDGNGLNAVAIESTESSPSPNAPTPVEAPTSARASTATGRSRMIMGGPAMIHVNENVAKVAGDSRTGRGVSVLGQAGHALSENVSNAGGATMMEGWAPGITVALVAGQWVAVAQYNGHTAVEVLNGAVDKHSALESARLQTCKDNLKAKVKGGFLTLSPKEQNILKLLGESGQFTPKNLDVTHCTDEGFANLGAAKLAELLEQAENTAPGTPLPGLNVAQSDELRAYAQSITTGEFDNVAAGVGMANANADNHDCQKTLKSATTISTATIGTIVTLATAKTATLGGIALAALYAVLPTALVGLIIYLGTRKFLKSRRNKRRMTGGFGVDTNNPLKPTPAGTKEPESWTGSAVRRVKEFFGWAVEEGVKKPLTATELPKIDTIKLDPTAAPGAKTEVDQDVIDGFKTGRLKTLQDTKAAKKLEYDNKLAEYKQGDASLVEKNVAYSDYQAAETECKNAESALAEMETAFKKWKGAEAARMKKPIHTGVEGGMTVVSGAGGSVVGAGVGYGVGWGATTAVLKGFVLPAWAAGASPIVAVPVGIILAGFGVFYGFKGGVHLYQKNFTREAKAKKAAEEK